MGVLADWQIKREIKIEPFEESLLRPGVISYGVSSYGYDVRVGRKFKLFTNVYGAIVDPKNFTATAFVDIEGDYCVIPPNSFALAETVEYIEVPRDILCVCLGKSTYARCFRGDTRVALVDGSAPTLEEMAVRALAGEMFWGYSIGSLGRMMVTLLEAPRHVGRDALMEVILDNGESIFSTPDHLFLRRDGRMEAAHDLQPGDSLMPLYRQWMDGTERVYLPDTGKTASCLHLMDEWKTRNAPPRVGLEGVFDRAPIELIPQPERCVERSHSASRTAEVLNHKVADVRSVPGIHDVYCLTVPEAGNFALEAGVFVRNCGIIVNVTPLEPEWRGKITIEISNTTPLPAKIYAGEGIAQILFLRGEKVCQTSYGDKRGKYQDQKGLTLPFVQGQPPPSSGK
jgi:deoxycytidine triphosphate deaminase